MNWRTENDDPRGARGHFAELVAEKQTATEDAANVNDAWALLEAFTEARPGIIADASAGHTGKEGVQ